MNKLTLFSKILIGAIVLSVVIGGCWFLGAFDTLLKPNNTQESININENVSTQETKTDTKDNEVAIAKETEKQQNMTGKTKDKMVVSLDEWIGWAPILEANGGLTTQKGSIYDKLGLDLEIVIMNDATQSSTALINGNVDGAGYTINRYAFLYSKFIENKINPKMVYITNYSSGGDGIIAKSGIKNVEDLVGKKIGVPRFSEAQTLIEWLLSKSNLNETQKEQIFKDMVMFDTPDDAAKAFFAGQLDAAATWQPYLSQAQSMTNSTLLFSTKNATNIILDGVIFSDKYIELNKDDVRKFVQGAIEVNVGYKTETKAVKNSMPLFSLEDDKTILEIKQDAGIMGLKENKDSLNGVAQSLFTDMSNIWIRIGEKADPANSEAAFTNEILNLIDVAIVPQTETKAIASFTQEQRDLAKEQDNSQALLKQTLSINFEPNLAVLKEDSYDYLIKFAETAKILNGSIIQIEGNIADTGVGDTESGRALSEQRAKAVAQYLQMQGIDASRFVIVGNGITKPVGDNATEEGKKLNRRTDLLFKVIE